MSSAEQYRQCERRARLLGVGQGREAARLLPVRLLQWHAPHLLAGCAGGLRERAGHLIARRPESRHLPRPEAIRHLHASDLAALRLHTGAHHTTHGRGIVDTRMDDDCAPLDTDTEGLAWQARHPQHAERQRYTWWDAGRPVPQPKSHICLCPTAPCPDKTITAPACPARPCTRPSGLYSQTLMRVPYS